MSAWIDNSLRIEANRLEYKARSAEHRFSKDTETCRIYRPQSEYLAAVFREAARLLRDKIGNYEQPEQGS